MELQIDQLSQRVASNAVHSSSCWVITTTMVIQLLLIMQYILLLFIILYGAGSSYALTTPFLFSVLWCGFWLLLVGVWHAVYCACTIIQSVPTTCLFTVLSFHLFSAFFAEAGMMAPLAVDETASAQPDLDIDTSKSKPRELLLMMIWGLFCFKCQ